MTIKAMRPKDFQPKNLKFPLWVEPKIDGCRAYNPNGTFLARTLKQFKNLYTTSFYSKPEYIGFDGEVAAERETHPDLCRITTSAIGTIEGQPYTLWHIFDFITPETKNLPYRQRYAMMKERIIALQAKGLCGHLRIVPYIECNNQQELDAAHDRFMELGYEGSCIYKPDAAYKEGNCSKINGPVWRRKDFIDTEAEVLDIIEGETNLNEAQINALGHTFRTSHQENKVPNGKVGCLICRQLEDVFDPLDETKILIAKDAVIKVSPGKMTDPEKLDFYANPHKLIKKIIKHKFFPRGIKDKPRFSNYQCIRMEEDL
jgi:DNA ligase 1